MGKPLTGLEIGSLSVKVAQVMRERHTWKLVHCAEVLFPPETIDVSNKSENIIDSGLFHDALRQALKSPNGGVTRVGMSLPNEIVKISIHDFDELPKSKAALREMIAWKEKGMLPYPVTNAQISHWSLSDTSAAKKRLLVALALQDIVRNYEMNLRRMRLQPEVIQPSAINHLNFYLNHIPPSGVQGFLGVFEDYFTFFVIEDGALSFYRGKRRYSHHVRFTQEISLTIQLYRNENPGKPIEALYLQSQVALPEDFQEDLSEDFDIETTSIDENSVITLDPGLQEEGKAFSVATFASAIGAAQSLMT